MTRLSLIVLSLGILAFTLSESNNFQIVKGKLAWQKTIQSDLSKEKIAKLISTSGEFKNVRSTDQSILAEIDELSFDFKGAGYSEMSTPIYIARSYMKAMVVFEFKEGRYRTTVKNIRLVQKYDDGLSEKGELTDIESYAVKSDKKEFKNSFLKKPSKIIDYTLTNLLRLKSKEDNDNW